MKKTATLFIVFILLLSQLGSPLYFKIQQWIIQEEQKEALLTHLPQNLLVRFTNDAHLEWEEENREFRFGHSLYDVAKITIEKGVKVYWAVLDDDETELVLEKMAALEKIHKPGNDKKQTTPIAGWQLLGTPPDSFSATKISSPFINYFSRWKMDMHSQFHAPCFGPPPQMS